MTVEIRIFTCECGAELIASSHGELGELIERHAVWHAYRDLSPGASEAEAQMRRDCVVPWRWMTKSRRPANAPDVWRSATGRDIWPESSVWKTGRPWSRGQRPRKLPNRIELPNDRRLRQSTLDQVELLIRRDRQYRQMEPGEKSRTIQSELGVGKTRYYQLRKLGRLPRRAAYLRLPQKRMRVAC